METKQDGSREHVPCLSLLAALAKAYEDAQENDRCSYGPQEGKRPDEIATEIVRQIIKAAGTPPTPTPVTQAAKALMHFLRATVGNTADWPIHIHVDNIADADALSALLIQLEDAINQEATS